MSHSQKDTKIREFFGCIFATTHVKAFFKEIEGFDSKKHSDEIRRNIKNSNAVFVLLGKNVQKYRFTNDWVIWETGIAKGLNKDIWVFEPSNLFRTLKVVIPEVTHYVIYDKDDVIIPEKDIVMLMIYKQIRNIYTHGDGKVNLLFIKKIRRYGDRINFHKYDILKIGDKIIVTKDIIAGLIQLTHDISRVIDKALLEQYPELKISIGIRIGKKNKKKLKKLKEQFGIESRLQKLKEYLTLEIMV